MIDGLRAAAVFAVAVAFVPRAHADNKDKARELYREATHHYDFGEYQQALDGFKQAYENYEDPAFLFNIAQCHRALGHKQDAITFYKSYLRNTPGAPNREEVQKTITELQTTIDTEKATAKPPVTDKAPPPAPPPPSRVVPATQPATTTAATTQADMPKHSRKWIWAVVAGAVVVVGVGVGLGVGLGTQSRPPKATYGAVSF